MCFASVPSPVTPAAAPPPPSPLALQQDPSANAAQEQINQYGAGGIPNMRRVDKSTTSGGVGATGAGVGTQSGGSGPTPAGLAM